MAKSLELKKAAKPAKTAGEAVVLAAVDITEGSALVEAGDIRLADGLKRLAAPESPYQKQGGRTLFSKECTEAAAGGAVPTLEVGGQKRALPVLTKKGEAPTHTSVYFIAGAVLTLADDSGEEVSAVHAVALGWVALNEGELKAANAALGIQGAKEKDVEPVATVAAFEALLAARVEAKAKAKEDGDGGDDTPKEKRADALVPGTGALERLAKMVSAGFDEKGKYPDIEAADLSAISGALDALDKAVGRVRAEVAGAATRFEEEAKAEAPSDPDAVAVAEAEAEAEIAKPF